MSSRRRKELFRARIETRDTEGFHWCVEGLGSRVCIMRMKPVCKPAGSVEPGHYVLDVFHTGPAWADTVIAGHGFTGPNHPNPTPWNYETMTDQPSLTGTTFASRFVADMDHAHAAYHDGFLVGMHGSTAKLHQPGGGNLNPIRWASAEHRAEVAADWIGGGYWEREGFDADSDARVALREIVTVLARFYEAGIEQGKNASFQRDTLYRNLREGALSTLSRQADSEGVGDRLQL